MQATLASPQCTLEPFSSQVWGAQAQAGTVHPQVNLDDAVQRVMLRPHGGKRPGSVLFQEAGLLHMAPGGTTSCTAHWLTMSGRGQWAGQAGREVLPRPINTTMEHQSLKIRDWYWVAPSAHAKDTSFQPTLVVLANV